MAATPLPAVLFLGAVAVLATIGMFVDWDDATRVVLAFVAAVVWGLMGLSSYDVYVDDAATTSEPIYVLVYLGIGLAGITTVFAVWQVFALLGADTPGTTREEI